MHRHGYKGRKFGRERDQREALVKSLADALIQQESIETTLPKAKEIVPYVEKLITKAKKGDLHNRRLVLSGLHTKENANKLVDEIAPKLTGRVSGHLRIERTKLRRGDNAQMARVSFVDNLKEETKKPEAMPATTKAAGSKDKAEAKK
jgi:large subunit ribosomal protein L17